MNSTLPKVCREYLSNSPRNDNILREYPPKPDRWTQVLLHISRHFGIRGACVVAAEPAKHSVSRVVCKLNKNPGSTLVACDIMPRCPSLTSTGGEAADNVEENLQRLARKKKKKKKAREMDPVAATHLSLPHRPAFCGGATSPLLTPAQADLARRINTIKQSNHDKFMNYLNINHYTRSLLTVQAYSVSLNTQRRENIYTLGMQKCSGEEMWHPCFSCHHVH